jgi:hypothetical protein
VLDLGWKIKSERCYGIKGVVCVKYIAYISKKFPLLLPKKEVFLQKDKFKK